uniref:Protein tyrosine phosphatase receptor type q isoform 1 n=1 Tax=Ixodes scapularis TaxID=6945 RepID=A0A4D5S5T8_IXOSC
MKRLLLTLLLFERAARLLATSSSPLALGDLKYDEDPFKCPSGSVLTNTDVCNGVSECPRYFRRHKYYRYREPEPEEEDSSLCAPKEFLWQGLDMIAHHTTNNATFLTWSSAVEPSLEATPGTHLHGNEAVQLSGYFLTGKSLGHTFQKILKPSITEYSLHGLKPWTDYNITLRKFYLSDEDGGQTMRIGRAAAVTVRTRADTPLPPREIKIISSGQGKVNLRVVDPIAWNGLPLKYHFRWEPRDPQIGLPGNTEIDIPSTRPHDQDWMSVLLSLEPGVRYIVHISAKNTGESQNITLQSPAISQDISTIPMDPINLKADSLSSREILVRWGVSGHAEFFRVNVSCCNENPHFGASSEPRNDFNGFQHKTATILVDGGGTQSSTRSVIVDQHPPFKNCTVKVEACSLSGCSSATTTSATVRPIVIPEPVITGVASNSTSSFEITWTFAYQNTSYCDGFLIRYCSPASLCRENYTHTNNINAINLSSDTVFDIEVRARIERIDGRVELGPPAKAKVSTWTEVPLQPGLKVRAPTATSNWLVLFWTFINSTVDYLQVSKNENAWTDCTDDVGCDMAVIYGWTPEFKTGFLSLKSLVPYTNNTVSLRGCSKAGCGGNSTVNIKTGMAAPGAPGGLKVLSQNSTGVVVTWEHPHAPAGPLNGYIVSWQCPSSEKLSTTVEDLQIIVQDLPQEGSNCTFWVSGFNNTPEGHLLVGEAANISLP